MAQKTSNFIVTYSLYFSSETRSRTGIPDRKRMIKVVNTGEAIAIHSMPLITLREITKIPHHKMISPKQFGCRETFQSPAIEIYLVSEKLLLLCHNLIYVEFREHTYEHHMLNIELKLSQYTLLVCIEKPQIRMHRYAVLTIIAEFSLIYVILPEGEFLQVSICFGKKTHNKHSAACAIQGSHCSRSFGLGMSG